LNTLILLRLQLDWKKSKHQAYSCPRGRRPNWGPLWNPSNITAVQYCGVWGGTQIEPPWCRETLAVRLIGLDFQYTQRNLVKSNRKDFSVCTGSYEHRDNSEYYVKPNLDRFHKILKKFLCVYKLHWIALTNDMQEPHTI